MELTQEEQGAIAVFESMKNSKGLSPRKKKLISIAGTLIYLKTARGKFAAYQFFGKLYWL